MQCTFYQVDVTKKNKEDFNSPPREGAYVHGLFMEGARWDTQTGMIAESRLKELTPGMPVMFIRAIPVDKQETKNVYECPVYKTRQRGPTYVWNFFLKTKESPAKWTLAGVALLLSAWNRVFYMSAYHFQVLTYSLVLTYCSAMENTTVLILSRDKKHLVLVGLSITW